MKTIFVKPADAKREWILIDAKGKPLGRVAAKIASIVRGKEKPEFSPNAEIGDFVVVINAAQIKVSGAKAEDKLYYHHTGFPGGVKRENYASLAGRKPGEPLKKAIHGMLPHGPLGYKLLNNVKIYAGAEHPHTAQSPRQLNF